MTSVLTAIVAVDHPIGNYAVTPTNVDQAPPRHPNIMRPTRPPSISSSSTDSDDSDDGSDGNKIKITEADKEKEKSDHHDDGHKASPSGSKPDEGIVKAEKEAKDERRRKRKQRREGKRQRRLQMEKVADEVIGAFKRGPKPPPPPPAPDHLPLIIGGKYD